MEKKGIGTPGAINSAHEATKGSGGDKFFEDKLKKGQTLVFKQGTRPTGGSAGGKYGQPAESRMKGQERKKP